MPGDFKTIAEAADAARAGDTVLIHGGVYEETIRVRSSGDDGAPITFKAAPGETVWLDGNNRFRANAIIIPHKHHIVIDGLRFRHFRFAPELGDYKDSMENWDGNYAAAPIERLALRNCGDCDATARLEARFAPDVKPDDPALVAAIEAALG